MQARPHGNVKVASDTLPAPSGAALRVASDELSRSARFRRGQRSRGTDLTNRVAAGLMPRRALRRLRPPESVPILPNQTVSNNSLSACSRDTRRLLASPVNNALIHLRSVVLPVTVVVGIIAFLLADIRFLLAAIILAGSYLGCVGAGEAHRDADVGLLKRGRIVDAIAVMTTTWPAQLQRFDQSQLLLGGDAGDNERAIGGVCRSSFSSPGRG